MQKPVNILHLSDIHLVPGAFPQSKLLTEAVKQIKAEKATEWRPDLVVISGDLAYSGDNPESYTSFIDIIQSFLDAAGLDEERVILCPGNHDADRGVVGKSLPDIQRWQSLAQTTDGANRLFEDGKYNAHIFNAFSNFNELTSNYSRSAFIEGGPGYATYFFRELGVALVTLNTATLTTAGLVNGYTDEKILVVPERTVEAALSHLPPQIQALLVGHHPLSWMNEANSNLLENLLTKDALAYLSGHLHLPRPRDISALNGRCYFAQAGALYEKPDRWNGFSIHSIIPGSSHVKAKYWRWYETRREFSTAEDLAPGGVYHSEGAKAVFDALRPPIDWGEVEKWRVERFLPSLVGECEQSLSGQPIESTFVPPEFQREVAYSKERDAHVGGKLEIINFETAIAAESNFLITGPAQSGKSTALRQWAVRMAREPATVSGWKVPVLIRFSDLRAYAAYNESLIGRQLGGMPGGLHVKELLKLGALTIFVEDVDFRRKSEFSALIDIINSYPTCRYILTTSVSMLESPAWEPVITRGVPFSHLRLHPLRRKQLLSLIEGHGSKTPHEADALLERVTREARTLNVPLTAVTGTFLIQIFNDEPDAILVNQATLVERYIELMLQKFAPKDVELKAFDFKLKRDLLSVIAGRMVAANDYSPAANDVLSWILEYIEHYGFPHSATDIVKYLVSSRIFEKFVRDDNVHIRFSLRAFVSYFVAWRMIESEEFRTWVFDPLRYLSYMEEISFYAALVRNDRAAINLIFGEMAALTGQMFVDASAVVRDGSFMDSYVEPATEASEEEVFAIQEVIRSNEESDSERNAILEENVGELAPIQDVDRVEYVSVGEKWIAHLILASSVLKHMELIPDLDKRKFLDEAITAWLQFCAYSLGLVPQIARDKVVIVNGITYRLNLSHDAPIGELARRLTLAMPISIGKLATSFLGSEKLRVQLEDGLGSKEMTPSRQIMKAMVLADIGVPNVGSVFERAEKATRNSRYLTNVFARKLYEVAIRFRLDSENLDTVRRLAGELTVKIENVKKAAVKSRQHKITENLRSQRIIADRTGKIIG